jgi:hypothetical protein
VIETVDRKESYLEPFEIRNVNVKSKLVHKNQTFCHDE